MLGTQEARWQLYRLLSEPSRLRLLAMAAEEELALSELSELLGESQPNVSRHAAPLRQAGLLSERRQGTRTFVRLATAAALDPVVADAVASGKELCRRDGSLSRIAEVVRSRDQRTREFFESPRSSGAEAIQLAPELPAYLFALGILIERRGLAVDAGTGDGVLLDALSPMFDRVVAFDRSEPQLERARRRVAERGYANVRLICAEADSAEVIGAVAGGADLVVASRMLHHAPRPRATLSALAHLLQPGGRLLVVDYCRHTDEELRERQADVWMGFERAELLEQAGQAGLTNASVLQIPSGYVKSSADGHVGWQVLSATREAEGKNGSVRPGHPG